jgi:hypothetical protein
VVVLKGIGEVLGLTEGKVIIKPKKLVDADDVLTPAQRASIDKRLAENPADIEERRVYSPFDAVDTLLRSLPGGKPTCANFCVREVPAISLWSPAPSCQR